MRDGEYELIRFPCGECGKLLGATPGMPVVVCPKCRLDNAVPTQWEASAALVPAVRVVSVDVPLPMLLRLGVKVAVAALPLVAVLFLAACGVVLVANSLRESAARRDTPSAEPPVESAEPPASHRPGWAGLLGVGLLMMGTVLTGGFVAGLPQRRRGPEYGLLSEVAGLVFLGLIPGGLGGWLCWWYFVAA